MFTEICPNEAYILSNQSIFKILLPKRDRYLSEKLFRLIPKMIDTEIPATYGYFYLQTVFFDSEKLVKNMKHYEKLLGWGGSNDLERICEGTSDILASWELSERMHMTQQDLTRILMSAGEEVLPSFGCGIAHLYLFTKSLLNLYGGRLVEPAGNDGLYDDLRSTKRFHRILQELRDWEKCGLWESVWAPFGGEPSEKKLKEIPPDKAPFSIEEIRWSWGYEDGKGNMVNGYVIDICDLDIHPDETLLQLEKRIDQALKPIRNHLSRRRPPLR